ncbi:post-PEP-CTERM-1 domain-containing protein [Paludibaculum fermentans]|uniref:Uncharacterized protein n=1 Tax=Paludibaculum fermentans TaxID=1473598 RepID=A0A7S7NSE7_PALFE|nr:hypothetical protein [Paludibaculum fermentans]QOY88932.1 hypothetical protein IRI77_02930 [Paludibaculum fermentans]
MSKTAKSVALATSVLAAAVTVLNAAAPSDQQPARAEATAAQPADTNQKSTLKPVTGEQAAPAGGVMIFKDPVTGKFRAPEQGEVEALTSTGKKSIQSVAPAAQTPFKSPTGAGIAVKLGAESRSYMVVTKTADGKLKESCVTGDKAATAVLSGNQAPAEKGALDEK